MPVNCPIDLDVTTLRNEVRAMYSRVAISPNGEFHFHRGPRYAATMLGYDVAELAGLPLEVTSSFAGIGNPHAIGRVPAGATVLDIGCGSGTDLLLAARRVGARGEAIGVDMTEAMRHRAITGAAACGLDNVDVRNGDATELPIDDRSIDVVISNGVLNLVPDKRPAIAEIARVLKPGGRVQIADIIIGEALSEGALRDIDLWTGWIAGALLEAELIDVFASAGFGDVAITARFDCFAGTTKERTARRYGVVGVNLRATRWQEWHSLPHPGVFMTATYQFPPPPGWTEPAVTPRSKLPITKGPVIFVDPAKACPAGQGGPMRVGPNIPHPPLLDYVEPHAPPGGVSGTVIVEVVVGTDGSVSSVRSLREAPGLTHLAVEAVDKWRYPRTCLNGQPIPVVMTVTVTFGSRTSLPERAPDTKFEVQTVPDPRHGHRPGGTL